MALTYDAAHSPPQVQAGWVGTGTGPANTQTTANFTPPAGSVIVVEVDAQYSYGCTFTAAITDSLANHLTWTLGVSQADGSQGGNNLCGVWVFWAYVGAGSPGPMSVAVTATVGDASGQYVQTFNIVTRVWTGANTGNLIGATSHNLLSNNPVLSVALTPLTVGSALCLAAGRTYPGGTALASAAATGCYLVADYPYGPADHASLWYGDVSGPTLTVDLSARTLGATTPLPDSAAAYWQYTAYELRSGAGTDITPPPVPAGLTVTTSGTDAAVSWSASVDTESGTAGYDVLITGPSGAFDPSKGTIAKTVRDAGSSADAVTVGKGGGSVYITSTAGIGKASYFTDGSGRPTLLRGDTAWGMLVNAGISGGTYQNDIDTYLNSRAAKGFNATTSAILGSAWMQGSSDATLNDGHAYDGTLPFVGNDPGVLNNAYWARVDYLVTQAAAKNISVQLYVCSTGDIESGVLSGRSTAQLTSYGLAVGTRYAAHPNILWLFGADYFGLTEDTLLTAVLTGIRNGGDLHMVAIENYMESTSRRDIYNNAIMTWGSAHADFNHCYSYNAVYDVIEYAYSETSPLPVLRGDGHWDTNTGETERTFMRNLAWWTLSSGARGYVNGREAIYPWNASSLAALDSSQFELDLVNIFTAYLSLPNWHQLQPDTDSSLLSAGRGTHVAHFVSGGSGGFYTGGNSYVTGSVTPDGSLALIYLPDATTTLTVHDTEMAVGYRRRWCDPVTGVFTTATPGGVTPNYTYTHPAANSVGGTDWVLVLGG